MSVKGFKLSDGTVVKYDYSSLDNIITDSTLSVDGVAADAGAVGDELLSLQNKSFDLDELDRLKLTGLSGTAGQTTDKIAQLTNAIGAETSARMTADTGLASDIAVERARISNIISEAGCVTPEMFGAVGDGAADDTVAFVNMFSSGKNIVIPANTYKLTSRLFEDDENILSNDGIFSSIKPVISKNVSDTIPDAKVFKYVNFTDLGLGSLEFQSATYDTKRQQIILGLSSSTDTATLISISKNFTTVIKTEEVTAYHVNDLTYNSSTDKIYCATMNDTNQIAVINPDTLVIENYITVGYTVYEITYDTINNIYFVVGNNKINIYDSNFDLIKEYSFSTSNIANVIGELKTGNRPEALVNQGSVLLNGQFCLVTNMTEYAKYNRAFLVQFNYKNGSVKKIYGWSTYGYSEEGETVIDVDGTVFSIGFEWSPIRRLIVTRLTLSGRAAIQPLSILQDDALLVLRTDGLTVASSRCEIVKGGYILIGDFVMVQLHITILSSLGAPNYWRLIEGFPRPEFYSNLSACNSNTYGNPFCASIDGSGTLYIHNDNALETGNELYITGYYLRYLYNQGTR